MSRHLSARSIGKRPADFSDPLERFFNSRRAANGGSLPLPQSSPPLLSALTLRRDAHITNRDAYITKTVALQISTESVLDTCR